MVGRIFAVNHGLRLPVFPAAVLSKSLLHITKAASILGEGEGEGETERLSGREGDATRTASWPSDMGEGEGEGETKRLSEREGDGMQRV